ncbi:MAG TPA: patatin-like phospholipase family protein, partial [Calditrichia bacterium]|nr:patatin-like phospholipase family protein [Calditrichia bacterium]
SLWLLWTLLPAVRGADSLAVVEIRPEFRVVGKYHLVNLPCREIALPRVALALSGGGARGLAHLGLLRVFEEEQLPLDLIVGTSIGSIIGGFYAAGYTTGEIEHHLEELNLGSLFSDQTEHLQLSPSRKSLPRRHILEFPLTQNFTVIPSSILQGQQVYEMFYRYMVNSGYPGENNFDHLRVPFRSVCTDLLTGQKVVLRSGNLAEAINGSMALPLLFAPVESNGMWLMDGGITDNLPVSVARENGAEMVVAGDVTAALRKADEMGTPWQIADQVTTIMMEPSNQASRRAADVLIRPELSDLPSADFTDAPQLVAAGYKAAHRVLPTLLSRIDSLYARYRGRGERLGILREIRLAASDSLAALLDWPNMQLPLGETLDREALHIFLEGLYATGYLYDLSATLSPAGGDSLDVTIHPQFNPVLSSVTVLRRSTPDSLIEPFLAMVNGKPLNMRWLTAVMDSLHTRMVGRGFPLFEITRAVYFPESQRMEIQLNEGVVDSIRIVGNRTTRPGVILRELPFQADSLLHREEAIQALDNIFSTNLFERAQIRFESRDGRNEVLVNVKEKSYYLARLGARVTLERQGEGFLELITDNFVGSGAQLSAAASISNWSRHFSSTLSTLRLFRTFLALQAEWFYQERRDRFYLAREERGTYEITRRGIRLSAGQEIERLGLISAILRVENHDVFSAEAQFPFADQYQIRAIRLHSLVDKRDRLPFPRKGIFNHWYWETGNQVIGSGNVPFTKIFLNIEGYYPLGGRWNYHPLVRAGSGDLTVPFSEFFSLGESRIFPGLYEREFL